MGTPSASTEPADETIALFDASAGSWGISNPHTLANLRIVIRGVIWDGNEESIIRSIHIHLKEGPQRDSFQAWVLSLIRNTPGYPLDEESEST